MLNTLYYISCIICLPTGEADTVDLNDAAVGGLEEEGVAYIYIHMYDASDM